MNTRNPNQPPAVLGYRSPLDEARGPTAGDVLMGTLQVVAGVLAYLLGLGLLVVTLIALNRDDLVAGLPVLAVTCAGLWAGVNLVRSGMRRFKGNMDPLSPQRLTERWKLAMRKANHEAWRRGQILAPEHLLLGTLAAAPNTATQVLLNLGIDPQTLIQRLRELLPTAGEGTDKPTPTALSATPTAHRVITTAVRLASSGSMDPVGTEHLLLALLRQPGAAVGDELARLGISADAVAGEIQRIAAAAPDGLTAEVLERGA